MEIGDVRQEGGGRRPPRGFPKHLPDSTFDLPAANVLLEDERG